MKQQIGNYEVIKELGQGGFATVYLGKHIHLGSLAAIKVLHGQYAAHKDLEAFRREAKTVAELEHRHIVRVLDFGVEEGVAFLIMAYAPFGSLRAQYGANVVPLDAVVAYVRQMAVALDYAHQHQVIHRDVKPENMLIDRENRILLSDFGMAQLVSNSLKTKDEVGGTAAYIAPEQLRGKPQPASDQYALAICVYEWLTGSWPFMGQTIEIISQHLHSPVPPMRVLVPSLEPALDKVVLRALFKNPDRRFATVGEFAQALQQAADVKPRRAQEEQFRSLGPAVERSAARSVESREFASVPTIFQPGPVKSTGTKGATNGSPISRRAVVFAGLGVLAVGGISLSIAAAQHGSAPSGFIGASPTARLGGTTPTLVPTAKPTAKPTQATATQPSTQTSQPPVQEQPPVTQPTQPPATPAGTLLLSYRQNTTIYTVAWSPDGRKIASAGRDKMVQIWEANTGNLLASYFHAGTVNYVAWSPDSSRIASASDDGTVRVCDASGNIQTVYTGISGNIHGVAWSPEGSRLASGGGTTVQVWIPAGNTLATFNGHTATVWGVAWSPDGTKVASGSGNSKAPQPDNSVAVWDLNSNAVLSYRGQNGAIFYVSWSPDGRQIASGSADGTVQVWNATTAATNQIYSDHTDTVYGVAWSPDGSRLASGSADGTVVIENVKSGGKYVYQGHTSFVYGVAWSPDGTRIASASADKTVQVWHT